MFTSAAAMLALSQARSYSSVVILAVFAGATTEMYRPASHALIGDIVPPEDRVIGFALYRFAVNLGFAFGPATAGFLANRSFFLIFAADAATSVPTVAPPIHSTMRWRVQAPTIRAAEEAIGGRARVWGRGRASGNGGGPSP